MVIPAHLQEISQELALRSWVNNKDFPKGTYFETIDEGKIILERHQRGDDDRTDLLVLALVMALDAEGLLLAHVLEKGTYDLNMEDREMTWFRACQAGAWVILQAYELACTKGDWPPSATAVSDG